MRVRVRPGLKLGIVSCELKYPSINNGYLKKLGVVS